MRLVTVLLGLIGMLAGVLAMLIASLAIDAAPRTSLAAVACSVGLLGTISVARCQLVMGAVFLLAGLAGLGVALGEYALIPDTCWLLAAMLALLTWWRQGKTELGS